MKDTFKHQGQRKNLVRVLKQKGITNAKILNAFTLLPRHWFIPAEFENHAYQDKAFPIDNEQTISQPYTVAYQTQLLEIKPGDTVLEIGTGSGFQAAVLCKLGVNLVSIERHALLHQKAKNILARLELHANLILGDGTLGYSKLAPYDKILVTAGAPNIPQSYIDQLKIGGMIVIPVGKNKSEQKMVLGTKLKDGTINYSLQGDFKFVPLLGKSGWK